MKFRTRYLHLSRKYTSSEDLKQSPPPCEVYICGSDQIWTPSFTASGEGKPTLSYFLDFGPDYVRRIAYAVSFGCVNYPDNVLKIVSPVVSKLDAISVRETSGCRIVHTMGINKVWLMPDPTMLLRAQDYESLTGPSEKMPASYVFFYMLHKGQATIEEIRNYFSGRLQRQVIDTGSGENSMMGMDTWLGTIRSADMVVTNSYHGTIFSILFKKPFIVVPVEGIDAGMNDRVFTLLGKTGLESRMIDHFDEDRIHAILEQDIDWDGVGRRIDAMREDARCFFERELGPQMHS